MKATLPDYADLLIRFGSEHLVFGAILLLFIFLASLLVLNMLIGVLCEVVTFVSSVEKEQLQVTWVRQELQKVLNKFRKNSESKTLTREEFAMLLTKPDAVKVIKMLGVDVLGLADFADFFFRGTDEIVFGDFMELVLQLRGSNKATVKDVVDLRRHIILEITEIKDLVENTVSTIVNTKSNMARLDSLENKTRDTMGVGTLSEEEFDAALRHADRRRAARGAEAIGLQLTGSTKGK